MTRKVRCGNTQKHTKMPADATPWEELSKNIRTKTIKTENVDLKEDPAQKGPDSTSTMDTCEANPDTPLPTEDKTTPEEKQSNKRNSNKLMKDKVNKKMKFQQKQLQQRKENGVTLLAPNQERKIYLLKKKLREKGYPPEMIKEITRKKRREEENKFKKTFTTKICFHCRERGHLLSNCPQRLGETKQVTGVCFKCGSTEHVSYRCQKKIEGYPLAKCFICKQQGHISKECPKNKRGVYIKGGACRECGNVNHLQKDCPLLVKKKEEPSISLYTIQEGTSMDAEIVENDEPNYKKKTKKAKLVKF